MAIIGVGIDVVDIGRFEESLRAYAGAARAAVHRAGAGAAARLAGRPVRGQGGARQGARRPRRHGTGTTPRWSRESIRADPQFDIRGTVLRPRPTSSAPRVHLSLSHDAGIASAVVVLED